MIVKQYTHRNQIPSKSKYQKGITLEYNSTIYDVDLTKNPHVEKWLSTCFHGEFPYPFAEGTFEKYRIYKYPYKVEGETGFGLFLELIVVSMLNAQVYLKDFWQFLCDINWELLLIYIKFFFYLAALTTTLILFFIAIKYLIAHLSITAV